MILLIRVFKMMILPVFYWFVAVAFTAVAVWGSLVVYHRYDALETRSFFYALGATAFVVAVAFFLPFEVFPFRILAWTLCSWLGMIGLVTVGRALYSGDDVPLVLVGLSWMAEALAIGFRGATAVRILVHGLVPWVVTTGMLFIVLLTVRAVFKHLDGLNDILSEEGFVILAGGVAVVTAGGGLLPAGIGLYRILSWVLLLWLILFGLVLVCQDHRQKRMVGLVMLGAACCVTQINPLFSWGIIAQIISWALAAIIVAAFFFLGGYYIESDGLCDDWASALLFCGLPLAVVVLLGVFLPGTTSAFKFLTPLLCVGLFFQGSLFFYRGFLNGNWRETAAGFCFFQGAFAVALSRGYVFSWLLRLGWEGRGLVPWLVFNGGLAAFLGFAGLGGRVFRLAARVRDWDTERKRAFLTEAAARLDTSCQQDLIDLSKQGFVRVRARGVDITAIDVRVENLTRQVFKIRISAGTCFIGTGQYQNMAVRVEELFVLPAVDVYCGRVPAVCVNAQRPVPSEKNAFFSVTRSPADLTRFLAGSAREDPMVAQAGAWALTDHYNGAQIQARLQRGGRPAISELQILRAKAILDELGITHAL
jgi:hypothetical protein